MSTPVPADQEVGPDLHSPEPVGALDVVSCVLEFGLIVGCAALLWRPSLADRPVARRGAVASAAALVAVPVVVIAATTAVMTPGWAGPEGPAGMASGSMSSSTSSSQASSTALDPSMGDMGTTHGLPDMQMYGEEHLLYNGPDPAYQGLNPQDPSSLVYAINVPNHAPILLGAMYIMGGDNQSGPQIGGGLTRWHSRLVPYPGGVFSDDLSAAATNSAVQAVLAQHS
jgi:hypothetical protein